MGTQKKRYTRGMTHASYVEIFTRWLEVGIEIYIETHGETGSPTGGSVDMPRLKKLLRELIEKNLLTVLEEVAAYKRSVSRHFPRSDQLLLRKTPEEVARSSSLSERKKFRFQKLVFSYDVMTSMVVAKTLANASSDQDEVVANSCLQLTGLLMMAVGDANHGLIPKHYIDTLRVCGLEIECVDGKDVEALNIDGLTAEALSQQCDRRQAALFGV